LVFANHACTELVLVVSSLILNTSVNTGDFETGFVPILGTFLLLGMPPLGFCKSFFTLGVVFGIVDAFSSRKSYHGFDAKIETNHVVDNGKRFDVVLYQHGNKVAMSAILGNRDRAGFAIFGKISMEDNIQRSIHLSKSELLSVPLEGIGSVASRLSILLLLE